MDTEHIEISNGDLFFTDGFGITHHIGTLNFSSGGEIDAPSGLPAVTSDDSGKVLCVSNGAWATVNAQSGGSFTRGLIDFVSDSDVKDNKESDRNLPDNISDELDGFLNSFRRKFDEYVEEKND